MCVASLACVAGGLCVSGLSVTTLVTVIDAESVILFLYLIVVFICSCR